MKEYVLTVDLADAPGAIVAYEKYHSAVWPEVLRSLRRVGVRRLDIFRLGRRLAMILQTVDAFDLERSFARHAASDPRCSEWEMLMKTFQVAPPGAPAGRLWTPMKPVFRLDAQLRRLDARTRGPRQAASVKARRGGRRAKPRRGADRG